MSTFKSLEKFFSDYGARMNRALSGTPEIDVEATAGAFADCFIAASPRGVSCAKNDAELRAKIPQGYAFYRSIGTKSMNITGVEITPLDDLHAMAKVHWDSHSVRKDGQDVRIEFDVIYLVQTLGGMHRIFGYITGDEQKVLKEHGLIPEDARAAG